MFHTSVDILQRITNVEGIVSNPDGIAIAGAGIAIVWLSISFSIFLGFITCGVGSLPLLCFSVPIGWLVIIFGCYRWSPKQKDFALPFQSNIFKRLINFNFYDVRVGMTTLYIIGIFFSGMTCFIVPMWILSVFTSANYKLLYRGLDPENHLGTSRYDDDEWLTSIFNIAGLIFFVYAIFFFPLLCCCIPLISLLAIVYVQCVCYRGEGFMLVPNGGTILVILIFVTLWASALMVALSHPFVLFFLLAVICSFACVGFPTIGVILYVMGYVRRKESMEFHIP